MTKLLHTTSLRYASGQAARNQIVTVFVRDTDTLAELFEDAAGTVPLANPTRADHIGNLAFYNDPGYYDWEAYDARVPFDVTSIGDGSAIVAQLDTLSASVTTLETTVSGHLASSRPHSAAESGRDFAGWYNAGIA